MTAITSPPKKKPVKQKSKHKDEDKKTETKASPTILKKAEVANQDATDGKKAIKTAAKAEEDVDGNSEVDESENADDANESVKEVDTEDEAEKDESDSDSDQDDVIDPTESVNDESDEDAEAGSKAVEEKSSESDPKQLVKAIKKSKGSTSIPKAKKPPKNELTHILPGYTAPLRLMTTWADVQTPSNASGADSRALEGLRRKAVRDDTLSKKLNENARLMSERSTTGNLTASYRESHASFHKMKRKRLGPSTETAGAGWFNMKATPVTEEVERDLALIRNRNYLDPKRFYKSADKTKSGVKPVLQTGTVIEGPTEYYSSRLTKKQRKTNLVDEIMADPESSGWAQQKYKKMQQTKDAASHKWGKKIPNRQDYRKKKAG